MDIKKLSHNSLKLLKISYRNFQDDRVFKLSAALSYYTVFSLPALVLVIISMTGIFLGEEAVQGVVFGQLNDLVGNKAALQIQETIKNLHLSGNSVPASIIGIITLLLGATGIFKEIQDSINMIWGLKAKPKKGFVKMLFNRMISFSLVIGLGFILLVSLIINGIIGALNNKLDELFPSLNVNILLIADYILQVVTITFLFAVIFKVLPDAKIKWRDVMIGAIVTAALFILGKSLLEWYLSTNSSIEAYGAAGSVILLLLWVYYSSAILYFGAEFTQAFATEYGSHIEPNRYAVWIESYTQEKDPRTNKKKIVADQPMKITPD